MDADLVYGLNGIGSGGGSFDGDASPGNTVEVLGAPGTPFATASAWFSGSLIMGQTPGVLQFAWCQQTPSGLVTTVMAGSYVQLQQVSGEFL